MSGGLDIVILRVSITSSWGNGHATTYQALVRALTARGHRVLFLERDQPWCYCGLTVTQQLVRESATGPAGPGG